MSKHKHAAFNDDQIIPLLAPFSIRPSADVIARIGEYTRILMKWNKLLSLTSIDEPAEIVARHFGESMYLSELLPVENCRLADVGTGAGFPGLALKILVPSLKVTLIESNKKKCAFLAEVVRALDLSAVEIISQRFEDIRPSPEFADIVTARAVGGLSDLLKWAGKSLSTRGHAALWVGGEDTTKVSGTPGWTWSSAVRIPESQRRFILVGRTIE